MLVTSDGREPNREDTRKATPKEPTRATVHEQTHSTHCPRGRRWEKHWSIQEASWQQNASHNPHLSLLGNKPQNKGFRKGKTLEESRAELYMTHAMDRAEGKPLLDWETGGEWGA